mgnify:CR=1 FL=1
MLFGKRPEDAAASPMLDLLGVGFGQSIDMLAAALGFRLDPEKRGDARDGGRDRPDHDAGRRARHGHGRGATLHLARGTVGGTPVVTVRVNWLMGERDLDPPWTIGGERFEVEVDGDPSIHTTFRGLQPDFATADLDRNPGIVATAMHCVNAIPYVCKAAPGIRTVPRPAADEPAARDRSLGRLELRCAGVMTAEDPGPPPAADARSIALSLRSARFLHVEAAGGIVLLLCTVVALGLANSRFGPAYHHLWETELVIAARRPRASPLARALDQRRAHGALLLRGRARGEARARARRAARAAASRAADRRGARRYGRAGRASISPRTAADRRRAAGASRWRPTSRSSSAAWRSSDRACRTGFASCC